MPRELNRLTAAAVRDAKPSERPNNPKLYSDGGGLYLQVMPSGSKSWLLRYAASGKPKAVGLGPLRSLSLTEAREEAARLRALVAKGGDPQVERVRVAASRLAAQNRTFRACAEEFVRTHEAEWKNVKHVQQWKNTLEQYAYPLIGDIPISAVDVHLVKTVLTKDNAWAKKNETMSRLRGRMERILGWATVLGYREGDNPARWTSFLSEVLPARNSVRKVKHHPAMRYQEIPKFLGKIRTLPRSMSALALEVLTLTALRTGEVVGAEWREIDLDQALWTIPAARMKARRIHRVPLCDRSVDILRSINLLSDGQFVFRGLRQGKAISNMAMLQLMRRMGISAVPHGMRSAFRDWVAEQTTFPRELAEAALAHVLENKTEAAYQRADLLERRRVLMSDWSTYCCSAQ